MFTIKQQIKLLLTNYEKNRTKKIETLNQLDVVIHKFITELNKKDRNITSEINEITLTIKKLVFHKKLEYSVKQLQQNSAELKKENTKIRLLLNLRIQN